MMPESDPDASPQNDRLRGFHSEANLLRRTPQLPVDPCYIWISRRPKIKQSVYDRDFFVWTQETARAIAEGRWDDIDRAALIDEVESLGKRDRREVESRLGVIVLHMLKIKYQPERFTRTWKDSISEQRYQLGLVLQDSPSLKAKLPELLEDAYNHARAAAANETGLDIGAFPEICEWTLAEILG
jgi:hypothetical protein